MVLELAETSLLPRSTVACHNSCGLLILKVRGSYTLPNESGHSNYSVIISEAYSVIMVDNVTLPNIDSLIKSRLTEGCGP